MIIVQFVLMAVAAILCLVGGFVFIVFPGKLLRLVLKKRLSDHFTLLGWLLRIVGMFLVLLGIALVIALVISLIIVGILLK